MSQKIPTGIGQNNSILTKKNVKKKKLQKVYNNVKTTSYMHFLGKLFLNIIMIYGTRIFFASAMF
jgi:hypothetical protein